jgi:predicted secreted hydrolase
MKRRHAISTLIGLKAYPALSALSCLAWSGLAEGRGIAPRTLVFPADFGAHPDTRIEWWYVTGTLRAEEGQEPGVPNYGFQVTFFRSLTEVPANHPSRFAATQLIFAHAAVTDLGKKRLRHDQRIGRAGFGVATAHEGDTLLSLRDWRLQREGPASQSLYRTEVTSEAARFALSLQLNTTQPVLLQGTAGFSRKGPRPEQASHYYSQPQLAVRGTLTMDGQARPVLGRAWLDHEWSNSVLDAQAVGWDWIGMNLDDGSALTAFRLRRADGSALWTGGSFRQAGKEVAPFPHGAVTLTPDRVWRSPASQASYPVEWHVATPAGRFTVNALLDDQELDSRNSTGSIYWEGVSELRNEQGLRVGRGYLEMTGYASVLQL